MLLFNLLLRIGKDALLLLFVQFGGHSCRTLLHFTLAGLVRNPTLLHLVVSRGVFLGMLA